MRKLLTLVLVLLFAAAAPLAWGQDDPGFEEDAMQNGDESEVVADEPGDEQVESDQGTDGQEQVEPEADEVVVDEPSESAEADESSAEQESFASDEDTAAAMTDGEDMAESEGGDASADDAAESDEASAGDSAAGDESADAKDQAEEEEESEDSADDEDGLETEDAAAEIADGEAQATDGSKIEGAGGNGANASPQIPAPAGDPNPAPVGAPAPAAKPTEPKAPGGSSPAWPTTSFRFMVDFGLGTGEVPFQEVTGLREFQEVTGLREGVATRYGYVTLKKGIFAKDNKSFEWLRSEINKHPSQSITTSTVTVRLLDESGSPVMTWTLANAWPRKVTVTDMKSDSNEVAVESIEIGHQGIPVTK